MKWIGQNIWSFISRFRSDVYLEASVNPAADVDKFLVQGTDGKVGFRTGAEVLSDIGGSSTTGDITSVVAGSNTTGGGTSGDVTLNVATASASVKGVVELATTAETTTGTDAGRVVTPDGLKDGYQGSSNVTTLGTIGTGVWNGTAVASAYLDADTAHLSGAQTFTGTKTLNSFKGTGGTTVTNILDEDAMGSNSATALATQQSIKAYADRPDSQVVMMRAGFKGDVTTTKYYIPLQAELEQTTFNHETNGFLAPFAGKLLKVMYRASGDLSGSSNSVTFRLEQVPRNAAWGTPTILETIAVDGPTNNTTDPNMAIASFVGGDGTNVFAAGDTIMVSLQHSADVSAGSTRHFFTLVFEMDYSGLA